MSCAGGSNPGAVARAFCNQTPGDLGVTDHFLTCGTQQCPDGCAPTGSQCGGVGSGTCQVNRKRIGTAQQGGVDPRLVLRNNKFKLSQPDTVSYSYPANGLLPLFTVVTKAGVVLPSGSPNVNYKGAWNNLNYQVVQSAFYRVIASVQINFIGVPVMPKLRDIIYLQIRVNGVSVASETVSEPAMEDSRVKSSVIHYVGKFNSGDIIDIFAFLDPAADINELTQASLNHIGINQFGT